MKLALVTICTLLPLFANCRVLPLLPRPYFANTTTSLEPYVAAFEQSLVLVAANTPTPPDTVWQKYVCRGEKLHSACKANKDKAVEFVTPVDAPFDSTLEQELTRWGYRERNDIAAASCWFDLYLPHEMAALNIDPRGSDEGGPNECFMFQHYDLDATNDNGQPIPIAEQTYTVDGKTYPATKAFATIGANSKDGVIFFINVKSAFEGAKETWGVDQPPLDQLPELRQISDMAWGIWRRKHPDGQNLGRITKFFVESIINPITNQLVAEALRTYTVESGQTRLTRVPQWPGIIFSMATEQGAAMLGSPNGIAVGYFLSQHKTQLGGIKHVTHVQVFLNDSDMDDPYMIFQVADALAVSSKLVHSVQPRDFGGGGTIVERSTDGRNMIREHVVMVNL